mgnify:FL=1
MLRDEAMMELFTQMTPKCKDDNPNSLKNLNKALNKKT